MESWQEKPCQHTLNCLEPSAEREAGLIVSGMSAMERKQKRRQNYIETALETNLRLGNTIPSTRGDLCSCFSEFSFTVVQQNNLESEMLERQT